MALEASYSLALLSEYTHTLDSLPIDLSRNFADLRELDAVLSSSLSSMISKIHELTALIEQGNVSKEDKLAALENIGNDARRLKLGGEDKIRVACQAADNLKAHSGHLRALADHLPGFDSSVLDRKTAYPHISERSYLPAATTESGRRRRGAIGSIMVASNPDPSPVKRKRVVRDDDIDIGSTRSPKKPNATEGNSRSRNNGRAKKVERVGSPSESLVSITSHLPPPVGHSSSRGGNTSGHSRTANTTAANNKRRAGGNNAHNRNPTPLVHEAYPPPAQDSHSTSHGNGSRRGGPSADVYNVPPSAAHPSLPLPYQNGTSNNTSHRTVGYDVHPLPHAIPGVQDWNIPHAQQLEGPGMPVARSASIHSTAANVNAMASNADTTDAGDVDGDGDDRTYCFCDGVSYGDMVACDDKQCEREWFHLACIGLTVPPNKEDKWYCEVCEAKRNQKKSGRGGKRKAGNGRGNAKS